MFTRPQLILDIDKYKLKSLIKQLMHCFWLTSEFVASVDITPMLTNTDINTTT